MEVGLLRLEDPLVLAMIPEEIGFIKSAAGSATSMAGDWVAGRDAECYG